MRGSIKENELYCSKDGIYTTFGLPFIGKGGRRDLQEYYEMVKEGKSDRELAEHDFGVFARTLKATDRIRLATRPIITEEREVILLCGQTRAGKTRWAYDNYPHLYEMPIGKDVWMDGYQGEEVVLLDEFEGQMPLNSALKLLEHYYVRRVPVKGSFVWFNPKIIIVTANIMPAQWYDFNNRKEKEEALRARFSKIYYYKDGKEPIIYKTDAEKRSFWPISNDPPVKQTVQNNYLNTSKSLTEFEVTQAIIEDPYITDINVYSYNNSDEEEMSQDITTL